MSRKQIFKLSFWAIFFVGLFAFLILDKQNLLTFRKPKRSKTSNSEAVKNETLSDRDKSMLRYLLLTQDRPWEPNATEVLQYRAGLGACCNASSHLVLTKRNTPLGSNMKCDGENSTIPVEADLLALLPETSPFLDYRYKNCAVVGNGGILRNSCCGKEIDQADLVIRFNLPSMSFPEDVGTKTNLVTINPSILMERFQWLENRRKPFADVLRSYGDSLFLISGFSFSSGKDLSYRTLYTMEDFGLRPQAFFLNPHYLGNLSNYWRKKGFQPSRLSSGFFFVNVALEFCQHITLYGFWPFPLDLDGYFVPYHYYDNTFPKAGVHQMHTEFSHYLSMHIQNVLRLRLGNCQ
ncbi:alpha-2,8-sialyltransferase 8F isoform X1 [Pogona vitticeps]